MRQQFRKHMDVYGGRVEYTPRKSGHGRKNKWMLGKQNLLKIISGMQDKEATLGARAEPPSLPFF